MTATTATAKSQDDYFGDVHVYQPHRTGIPNIPVYARELWARRHFAVELSRSGMRAAHTDTFFGRLWLVLNPLLLAAVYFVLVDVIGGKRTVTVLENGHSVTKHVSYGAGYFAHLCAGLFAFYLISGSMMTGGSSVISGGKLVVNSAFPRLLLPLSAVRTALYRFFPTMIVYGVLHVLAGNAINLKLLVAVPILFLITLFGAGLACLFGMLFVYFRDLSSFIPYLTRIWLYLSPVLFTVDDIHKRFAKNPHLLKLIFLNPLYSLLGMWSNLLADNKLPSLSFWIAGIAWAVGTFVLGALVFMSREREFAVRI